MNKKPKYQKYYILGILLMIMFTILGVLKLTTFSEQVYQSKTGSKMTEKKVIQVISTPGGGTCPGSGGTEIGSFSTNDVWATAGLPGTYCMEHGVIFRNDGARPWAELKNQYTDGGMEKTYKRNHACVQTFSAVSNPWLKCSGAHENLAATNPALAYAVASGSDREDVQNAVWGLGTSGDGVQLPSGDGGRPFDSNSLNNDAWNDGASYGDFQNATGGKGINAQNNTEKVYTIVDYENKEITLGPYNIDYVNAGMFGGISEAYFVGYNADGKVVKEKIPVKRYGENMQNTDQKLQYFKPNEDEGLIDKNEHSYISGKGLYYTIDDPNKSLTEDSSKESFVTKYELHIKFQWMELTKVEVCKAQAYVYRLKWKNHNDIVSSSYCNHTCGSGCYTWISGSYDKNGKLISPGYFKNTCTHTCSKPAGCYQCSKTAYWDEEDAQDHMIVLTIERTLFESEIIIPYDDDDIERDSTMELGGKVWENMLAEDKESTNNPLLDDGDRLLPNVKVTLFAESGKLAKLLLDDSKTTEENVLSRINPTYTDENGEYHFKGLDPSRKYYVQFEYNGQTYLPTEYDRDLQDYYKEKWAVTSKSTENEGERNEYNEKFKEIGSYPANYESSNSLGVAIRGEGGKYYNAAFSQHDLKGFKMSSTGAYVQEMRLIDSFDTIQDGMIVNTDELQEGIISTKIKEFIKNNKKTPDRDDMIRIYNEIANGNAEIAKKLQFIEDTNIKAYSKAQSSAKYDLYPAFNKIILNDNEKNAKQGEVHGENAAVKPIYPGQFYINLGLDKRETVDLSLRKDILYAATTINGKTEIYEYNKRNELTEEQKAELKRLRDLYEERGRQPDDYQTYLEQKAQFEQENLENGTNKPYWEIQLRMIDYNKYYGENYTRELYPADYNYRSSVNGVSPDNELELYVTYKITVRNLSENILGEITEVVDYYDKDYEYCDDLSWVMYENKGENGERKLEEVNFVEKDYYDTVQNQKLSGNIGEYGKDIEKNNDNYNYEQGQYIENRSTQCESDMTQDYQALYIRGLQGKKLASGDEAYIYLTFKVRKENGAIITDEDENTLKQNYAEINGYKTYYTDGTKLPNGITKNSSDAAGIIDENSTPGNLCEEDITSVENGRYEQNFENDTDRAKSIKVIVKEDFIRSINGTVWEDERTQNVSDAMIGDGIRTEKDKVKVSGATVELVERLANGKLYVWQTTKTNPDGTYKFETDENNKAYIIPGNYFVRFKYGDTLDTVNTDQNGGTNKTSYNGQDFKSTVYQKDMTNGKELQAYKGTTVNEYDGKYDETYVGYYDIKELDKLRGENGNGTNFSDARDIWKERQKVIDYSTGNVTNELAEILASPYTTPYDNSKIEQLMENTNMTAVTGLMVLEGEYARTSTDGDREVSNGSEEYLYGNDVNGNYTVNAVDFGITERPKAQLELGKKITNIKIVLANGAVQFDANKGTTDLLWPQAGDKSNQAYKLSEDMKNNKYPEYYGEKDRYAYRETIKEKLQKIYKNNGMNGLIVATMDDELMQGATIQISYALTVTNVGETDYYNAEQEKAYSGSGTGNSFYYKGTGASNKVTTSAEVVADYVANNLNFKAQDGWNIVEGDAVDALKLKNNNDFRKNVATINNVISTQSLNKALAPGESATANLVLTQLINPQNSDDDRSYENMAEITTISNTAGRRMAFSIQGNQDPTQTPTEVDSSKSERVTILPPFGIGNIVVYIAVAVGVLIILAGGIIFIKKKVLKR